ncbi:MAG: Hemoglobin [Phenylobacterium sp.]|nr:Hemoglobin [Phenylobacterium sp.]
MGAYLQQMSDKIPSLAEWMGGMRLAVINSADGAGAPEEGVPMPSWNWGPPGGPYLPPSG